MSQPTTEKIPDGMKIKILKQYADIDGQKVCLHKHGGVGDVIVLSIPRANELIALGWAVAV